jgi:hypothetical protein
MKNMRPLQVISFCLIMILAFSCQTPASSGMESKPDTMAEIQTEEPSPGGQRIGELLVDWESSFEEDPDGSAVMGGNGLTYLAISGNDRYRLNILDLNEPLADAGPEKREIFETGFLRTYKNNLIQMDIPFSETEINGIKALEFSVEDTEKSAKSLLFIYGNNAYTLQVVAEKEVDEKFNRLVQAVRF